MKSQIESLPMNGAQGGNLQNVLSISTAANNRYLLHFNSLSSLTQWTAGIRLAMFEHSTLQEAYTGSLLAGKGKYLNNIKQIMERSKFAHEDWARVRFGAGTPWKRCWCVISPPDEKEYQKAQKTVKKGSAYERIKMPKGDIKFYDTRKITKKTRPIATISDAYAAYAIYPQSKPLIDQSTLVKLEGLVTIHGSPETTSEGFVFVMPEVHAAVTGFEMMLRWLFPVFDTFALYGRPSRLIADTLDQKGLMFAMPKERRYGHLDILDVSNLIHTKGSQVWSERQWRRELKRLTSDRILSGVEATPPGSRNVSQRRNTTSRAHVPGAAGVRFGDEGIHSTPGSRSASPVGMSRTESPLGVPKRTDSAPPGPNNMSPHTRSVSEAHGYRKYMTETPSRLSHEMNRPAEDELPPPPPKHGGMLGAALGPSHGPGSLERIQSQPEVPATQTVYSDIQAQNASPHLVPPEPVGTPPVFTHQPNDRPANRPYQAPELRRAHSNVDAATLYQMQDAMRPQEDETWEGDVQQRQQNTVASYTQANRNLGLPADSSQGVVNRNQRDPRQRLSTIPGSPFVGDGTGYFESPVQAGIPQMDGVAEERPSPNDEAMQADAQPAPPVPIHSSHSIARKPVPKPLPDVPIPSRESRASLRRSVSDPTSPTSPVNTEGWEGAVIDQDALERVLNGDGSRSDTMQSTTTASTEPDYASTPSVSTKGRKSIEKPRPGKLKTVGDPELPAVDPRFLGAGKLDTWKADQEAEAAEIPGVDFGPTYAYKPNSRPNTSGTLTPGGVGDKRRSLSADRLRDSSRDRLSGTFGVSPRPSPNENNRHSYFGGRTTPDPGRMTPEYANSSGERSSFAWQPGVASPGGGAGNRASLSPEQWVQHKAALAQQPQYAPPRKAVPERYVHNRQFSSSSVHVPRKLTKTPPLPRTLSGDWTQARQRTPPSRPQSRGAGINLDSAGTGLSAREQMQVSRATGTPLVNVAASPKQQEQDEQPGLVGHVAARERDKAASKAGRNSMAVQHAIVERQQQQIRMEAEAQAQAQAQAQYQMQMQAAQQAQTQQLQNQMNWNNMMMSQSQAMQYGGGRSPIQRPGVQTRSSWQYGQQSPQNYNLASSGTPYSPAASYDGSFVQAEHQQAPQQQYGASYLAQQQQQGDQGQQWARR